MARERTADDVRFRFRDEQEYIERYTRLLHSKSTIYDEEVRDLNSILTRVWIQTLPARDYDRTAKPYSREETTELLAAIRAVEPEVYQTILGHEQRLDDVPSFGFDGPAADHLDRRSRRSRSTISST